MTVEAYRKGIPTIIHDRKIQSDEYTVSIGANNYNIGSAIGEYINGQLSPNSQILEIWGLEGSSPAMERHDGFIDHLRSDKNFRVTQILVSGTITVLTMLSASCLLLQISTWCMPIMM